MPITIKHASGDMLQYFAEHPDKLREKRERDKKASFKLDGEQKFRGLDIAIENAKGSTRMWKDEHGKETGSTKMHCAYGYIRLTKGTDGDHVDVYIGPDEDAADVFIVDQMKKPDFKEFDEQKCLLGFSDAKSAKAAYLKQYNDPRFFGSMKAMPFEEFKMKVLDKKNHGVKIAFAVSPGMLSGLQHAGVGAGIGAVAGGLGGMAHAGPEHRGQGALRGALVGGALGAGGGAAIANIKGHAAQQLASLQGAAQGAEQAAVQAHRNVAGSMRTELQQAAVPPRIRNPADPNVTKQFNVVPQPVAPQPVRIDPALNTAQHQASAAGAKATALAQAAHTLEGQQAVMNRGINRAGLIGAAAGTGLMGYTAVPRQYGGIGQKAASFMTNPFKKRVAPELVYFWTEVQKAPHEYLETPSGSIHHSTLEQELGSGTPLTHARAKERALAEGVKIGADIAELDAKIKAMEAEKSLDARVGKYDAALDSFGIGALAAPYAAESLGHGLTWAGNKIMSRSTQLGAGLATAGNFLERGAKSMHHSNLRELGGLALVTPMVTHPIAHALAKRSPQPVAVPPAAPPMPAMQTAEKIGRLLAQPREKIAINVMGAAKSVANFAWQNKKPLAGIAAVGAVGAGLYGAKKGIDTAANLVQPHHAARFVGAPPGQQVMGNSAYQPLS